MNPFLAKILTEVAMKKIGSRLVNKKKLTSKTNVATALSTITGSGAGYMFLLHSDDIRMVGVGAVLTLATLLLPLYKDKQDTPID